MIFVVFGLNIVVWIKQHKHVGKLFHESLIDSCRCFSKMSFWSFPFLGTFYYSGVNDMLVSYSVCNLQLPPWLWLTIPGGSSVWPSLLESILKWSTIKALVLSANFWPISFNSAFWALNLYPVAHVGSCCHGKISSLSIYFCQAIIWWKSDAWQGILWGGGEKALLGVWTTGLFSILSIIMFWLMHMVLVGGKCGG